jgi:hypothetical protein
VATLPHPWTAPTLSKEYLAGNASEERVPLRPKSFYSKTPSIMKSTVAVPAFWNQHYDVPINYVGHAECWDKIAIEGDIPGKDCVVRFKRDGRTLAIARSLGITKAFKPSTRWRGGSRTPNS